jgi:hypothetical protein
MSRHNEQVIGKLVAANGREIEITNLRIDTDGEWWAGRALLSWGSILHRGLCRLVMNDGRAADVIVDDLQGDGTGGEFAAFRGRGPAPEWAVKSDVYFADE